MRTLLVASLLGLVVTSVACGGSPSGDDPADPTPSAEPGAGGDGEEAASAPASPAGSAPSKGAAPAAPGQAPLPTWLVGAWRWKKTEASDLFTERYTLGADGTGRFYYSVFRPLIPYGAGDESGERAIKWSATDTLLELSSAEKYEVTATPNCRLIDLKDTTGSRRRMFSGVPGPGCPFTMPPLTPEEQALVGRWRYDEPASGSLSAGWGTLELGADRHVTLTLHPRRNWTDTSVDIDEQGYFTLDSQGMLHGVHPDGEDVLGLQPTLSGADLQLCPGCISFTRSSS
jgi:hypothetical protein